MAGSASTITANVAGITMRVAYFTEDLKTLFRVSRSVWALIFEKAGNRMVFNGTTKKVIMTAKLRATW